MARKSWSLKSPTLGHGIIWRRLPSNGDGMQLVLTAPVQVGWRESGSAPVLIISANSANVSPPIGIPVLSGVKLREIMFAEPATTAPKLLPPPRYVAGLTILG